MKLNIAILLAMLVFAIEPEPNFDGIAAPGAGNRPVLRVEAPMPAPAIMPVLSAIITNTGAQ